MIKAGHGLEITILLRVCPFSNGPTNYFLGTTSVTWRDFIIGNGFVSLSVCLSVIVSSVALIFRFSPSRSLTVCFSHSCILVHHHLLRCHHPPPTIIHSPLGSLLVSMPECFIDIMLGAGANQVDMSSPTSIAIFAAAVVVFVAVMFLVGRHAHVTQHTNKQPTTTTTRPKGAVDINLPLFVFGLYCSSSFIACLLLLLSLSAFLSSTSLASLVIFRKR